MIITENKKKNIVDRRQKIEEGKMNLKSILVSCFSILASSHQRGFTPTPTFKKVCSVVLPYVLLNKFKQKFFLPRKLVRGFILPFALMLSYIILIISMGISDILTKEMYFSYMGRESQIAYYSADAGLDCALYIDSAFVDSSSGIGIFPYDDIGGEWERGIAFQYNITNSDPVEYIKCAGSYVFHAGADISNYNPIATASGGVKSTFLLKMNQGDGNLGCAEVSVTKTLDTFTGVLDRIIISRGFNTCTMDSSKLVERAVINRNQ